MSHLLASRTGARSARALGLILLATASVAAACARDAGPPADAGVPADGGSRVEADAAVTDAEVSDAAVTDAEVTDRSAAEGRGVPAVVPPTTACADAPRYDATGEYAVLRPETSAHIVTSPHFAARWNDADNVPLTEAEVASGLAALERIWDLYLDAVGFPPPYLGEPIKYKVSVNISDQGWATGSGTGARDPEMWVHYDAFRDVSTLAHEFAHTLQFASGGLRDSRFVGWAWESHAEWMTHQTQPTNVACAEALVNAPHLYYGSTRNRYCNWQFWEFLKDQYCYRVVNDLWARSKRPDDPARVDEDPFGALARNLGFSASQLNDVFGVWAMHAVTWDYPSGAAYRAGFGPYTDRRGQRRGRVTQLDALDAQAGRYVVPEYWAPQRWGYNLVRLFPDTPGQDTHVEVDFRGVVQDAPATSTFEPFELHPPTVPAPSSDWRWGLVAVDAAGAPRYGALHRGAEDRERFEVRAGDQALWLVVVATPTENQPISWDQAYYTIYRYPWRVELTGARPEGFEPGATAPPVGMEGAPHVNGGGWVASTARVAATAYVGPSARVLGRARVDGEARIEDEAVVDGDARVEGRAVVRGRAWVTDEGWVSGAAIVEEHAAVYRGQVTDDARVGALTVIEGPGARVRGAAEVRAVMNGIGDVDLSGTAQVLGDVELWTSLARGVFYGLIVPEHALDPRFGADRVRPRPEVTAPGPYSWP